MSTCPANVAVVGGSIAGLCAALALSYANCHVTLLEKRTDEAGHDKGAGVVLGEHMVELFRKFEVSNNDFFVTNRYRLSVDVQGNIVAREARQQLTSSWNIVFRLLKRKIECEKQAKGWNLCPSRDEIAAGIRYYGGQNVLAVEPTSGSKVMLRIQSGQNEERIEHSNMVIIADGSASSLRASIMPKVKVRYVGYAAWRGTVLENDLTKRARDLVFDSIVFFREPGVEMIVYRIPDDSSANMSGIRLVNWVWYQPYPSGSREHQALMTDRNQKIHRTTVSAGLVEPELWIQQQKVANERLPPQFAEIVQKTAVPFVQGITEVISDQVMCHDGKVAFVGDALAGFRPHTGESTNQAAFDALQLNRFWKGEISREKFESSVMGYALKMYQAGQDLGRAGKLEV